MHVAGTYALAAGAEKKTAQENPEPFSIPEMKSPGGSELLKLVFGF